MELNRWNYFATPECAGKVNCAWEEKNGDGGVLIITDRTRSYWDG